MQGSDGDRTPAPAAAADGSPLERFAEIEARLAEKRERAEAILARVGLDAEAWSAVRDAFAAAFAREAFASGEAPLADRYAALFVTAQDAIAPVPDLTPEAWAELVHAASGGGLDASLAERGLTRADYARLSRHWAARLGKEPPAARQYAEAFYAAAKKSR
jgi:hypothetical protein